VSVRRVPVWSVGLVERAEIAGNRSEDKGLQMTVASDEMYQE